MNSTERLFPMNKPDGFVPSVQRYSADHPSGTKSVTVMYLGVQSSKPNHPAFHDFRLRSEQLAGLDVGPVFHDFSQFTDPQGNATQIMVAYWYDQAAYTSWSEARAVSTWWQEELSDNTDVGYFREVFTASINNTETIAFKEFVTGLSACPRNAVKPMGESGYWGAARDRIPASAVSLHETQHPEPLEIKADRKTKGQRIVVTPPKNLTLIRSGVSWQDCGPEQLDSYLSNLKPALDEGMEFLRQNPVDTGCCCMRQVDTITVDNKATKENYCAGYFLSFDHLESWAHKHPTHLAIYGRAQKERMKYKENLELRTYHEVYIIDGDASFEYVNCHKQTGLLPYF